MPQPLSVIERYEWQVVKLKEKEEMDKRTEKLRAGGKGKGKGRTGPRGDLDTEPPTMGTQKGGR